jgi:hypothetical protein
MRRTRGRPHPRVQSRPGLSGPVNPHRRRPAHTFDGTTHHDFPRLLDDIA